MGNSKTDGLRREIEQLDISDSEKKGLLQHLVKVEKSLELLAFQCRRTLNEKSALSSLLTQISEDLNQKIEESERKSEELAIKNEKLLEARKNAEKATAVKSQFLANMSHEIRTPMNGVLGMLQLLELNFLTPEQQKYVQTIRTGGESLLGIINEILDFSKIEAGKIDLEEAPFQIQPLLQSVVDLLRPHAEQKRLSVMLSREPNIPDVLIGDMMRIRQVLINLLANAIKFTHEGYIHIEIESIGHTESECLLYIQVHDTGIGISEEHMERLFQPFMQADASTTRKYGGTGLGLAISMGLIRLMGGDIGLRSKVGTGSSFFLMLPLKTPHPTEEKSFHPSSFQLPKASLIHELAEALPLKILLADDNEMNQIVAESVFEKMGYEITMVDNGKEALTEAIRNPYDIIFMDLQMPVMDGAKATRCIRSYFDSDTEPVIIAMTANAFEESQECCMEAGMNDFLTKPFALDDLQTLLLKWGKYRKQDKSAAFQRNQVEG